MSLIRFTSVGSGMARVHCPRCNESVGIFEMNEMLDMSRSGVVPLCFDCDSLDANKVPDALRLPEMAFCLVLDNQPFFCVWDDRGFHVCRPVDYLTWATLVESGLWRGSPLSSSSKRAAGSGVSDG